MSISSCIDAAFRSIRENEVYLFIRNKYVLIDYAPGTTDDKILNGPLLVGKGFPSLINTPFEEGIDCAFNTDYDTGFPFYTPKTEAFIFSYDFCAYIDYAPGTTNDRILSGPMTIADMFPFFEDTVFESGIDAAFSSSRSHEAYLFRGDKYALVDYDSKNLIHIRNISDGFPSLQGTILVNDIDAGFASHRENEAYLFKGDQYALINFAPGTTDDYIIGGVKPILPNWPSLNGILPLNNQPHVHDTNEQDDQPNQQDQV